MSDPRGGFEEVPASLYDVGAEQIVLGGMLLSGDAIADVVGHVRGAGDFYRAAHRTIYDCILDLYGRGDPVSPVTLLHELTKRGEVNRVGTGTYLHTLISAVPTTANAGHYAGIVAELATRRDLWVGGGSVRQHALNLAAGIDEVAADLDRLVESTRERADGSGESSVDRMLAELLDTADLDDIPALEPLIDEVLFRDTLARIYGASGAFKSFMTIGFAACVGTGMDWHGRSVRQGLVIYIVAEGVKGVRKRVRAWEQYHERKMTGVKFLPRPVQVKSPEWGVLIEVCRRLQPALVIVDTQARVTVGVEENSATEMGVVLDHVEQMRSACEACVLLVHHTGIDGERGRGSTSIKGGMQTELGVTRKGKALSDIRVTLSTGKQKDDEELQDVLFRLEQVRLADEFREDGHPVTSIVLVPAGPAGPLPGSEEEVMAKLDAANIPLDWGRRKVRTEMTKRGVPLARDEVLGPAIQRRRDRAEGGSQSGSQDPRNSKIAEPLLPVPDDGTTRDGTTGQTGSEPPGTTGNQGAEAGWFPPTPPLGVGTTPHRELNPRKCEACGQPTESETAALCRACRARLGVCPDCGFEVGTHGHEENCERPQR